MKVTKEDLLNLAADKMKIRDLQKEIDEIREAAAIAQYQYNITPGCSGQYHDVMADKVDKLIQCENERLEAQFQFEEHHREVLDRIRDLSPQLYEVIWKRYVEDLSWRQIARKMSYSESNVRKLHARALVLLQAGD